MSTRDSKYDCIRVRPRKDKDKDSDKRSSIAGTGGIIVKKHRDSTTARSVAPSDSASQVCTDAHSQLPGDASSSDKTATSTLLRHSSAAPVASRPPLSSIQTPAALQPFLESEGGDSASLTLQEFSTSSNEVKQESIGPIEEVENPHDDPKNSITPRPMRRAPSKTKEREPDSRSSVSLDGPYENPFLPSQTTNSSSATASTAPPASPHVPIPVQPHHQPYPLHPSSPAQSWHDAPSQRSSSVVSASRSVTSDPSSTTTYIAHAQPKMLHPQEHPMMLLQRVSSAMPDIYMLMQRFQESCATLGIRESQIRQLEMQKEADAKRQDSHIDRLTKDIEATLAKHAAKVENLETKISKLEDSKASLQRNLTKEAQSKEDARASIESLQAQQKQQALKYLQEREQMVSSQSTERNRLISEHAASQRALSDHSQAQARIAEANMSARLGELNKIHEHERQALVERRTREKRELEEGHAQIRRDLEDALAAKVKIIDDERRDGVRMRQALEKEHDELSRRRDEERARHRKDLEEQYHDLMRKHQKERDEIVKSLEASHAGHQAKNQAIIQEQERALETHSRQVAEAQTTIAKLQRDAEGHKRYTADVQEAFRKLQRENADLRSSLETAQSHQQQPELPDSTRRTHIDHNIQNRSRTPSRQR